LDDQQTSSHIINEVTLKFKGFSQEELAFRCCDDLVTSGGNGPALWLTLSEGMSCCIGQSARKVQVADQMRSFFSYCDSLMRLIEASEKVLLLLLSEQLRISSTLRFVAAYVTPG
jgi:hypothetical protein